MRLARDMADREMTTLQFDLRAEGLVSQFPELLALSWIDDMRRLRASQASPSVSPLRDWVSWRSRPAFRPAC